MAAVALAPRHWVYLDAQRTHEVHAQVASQGADGIFVTTEFPMGSREPTEVLTARTQVRGEEQLVTLLRELEERLALGGTYFRADARELKWEQLPPATTPVDLRAHEAPLPGQEAIGAKMRFHHFHAADAERDRLLIAMPRPGMSGRHVLAEMRFEFPRVDEGELSILHTRLSPPMLASVVAKEHLEAPRRGWSKLFEPRDYERAYGSGWTEKARAMFQRAAARLVAGPAPAAPAPTLPVHGPPARLPDMQLALQSPRVNALRARWLDAVTEARLVEGGEHSIRRWIAKMRKEQPHQLSYDISILEAALLLEYAIPAKMWDLCADEGAKLLRFLHGYG